MPVISKEAFEFKKQLENMKHIQNIALCGMFIALYIVLSYFNIRITENIEVRFAFLALAMAGCYGGPVMGMTVGIASDILSMVMTAGKGASFFFGFTISYALLGFLFGFLFYKTKTTVAQAAAAALCYFLVGITLNTVWLHMMYGMPLQALFVTRLIKELILLPVNGIMLYVIVRFLVQALSRAGIIQRKSA